MAFDIVVVGGGPAGLSAAKASAEKNVETLVLEKNDEIGSPIRTSGGSWIDFLDGIPLDLFNPVSTIRISSTNRDAIFNFGRPAACVLDVRRYYQYLAVKAIESGAEIRLNSEVRTAMKESSSVKGVQLANNECIKSKVVIDASGFVTCIGRSAGLVRDWKNFGIGVEFESYVQNLDESMATIFYGEQLAIGAYGWVFPLNEHRARIGVGIMKPESEQVALALLQNIIRKRPKVLKDLGKIVPLEYHYGAVPLQEPVSPSVCDGLILVGDAASQATPIVGEGIRNAVLLGALAGQVAADAVHSQDYSSKYLSRYESMWKERIQKNHKIGYVLQQAMVSFRDKEWDDATRLFESLTPDECRSLLRCEFSLSLIGKVTLRNPSLAGNIVLELLRSFF